MLTFFSFKHFSLNEYKCINIFACVTHKYILCEIQAKKYSSLDKHNLHVPLPFKMLYTEKKKVTPNGFLVWENTSSEQQNWLFLFCIRKYTYTWNCQCYFTMTEQNTSIRIVQLVHTITGLTIFLYPYFFFFKSLVLMEEVRAYPIFHISFTLFK